MQMQTTQKMTSRDIMHHLRHQVTGYFRDQSGITIQPGKDHGNQSLISATENFKILVLSDKVWHSWVEMFKTNVTADFKVINDSKL